VTRAELLARLRGLLAGASIETPGLDARLLVQHALGIDAAALLRAPEAEADPAASDIALAFAARRITGEPVARILGSREFFGLSFRLGAATLVPRPDTEVLVAAALARLQPAERPWRLIDLGTGSGAILVALLAHLPRAWGVGVDLSQAAASVARTNAHENGVAARAAFMVGDWLDAVIGRFDAVVANPPYIAARDISLLDREVRDHDPLLALDGGADGLDCYRNLLRTVGTVLAPDGFLGFELGAGQAPEVADIATMLGWRVESLDKDAAGIDRAMILRHN
jgi:release factor glutamine methyltransferase